MELERIMAVCVWRERACVLTARWWKKGAKEYTAHGGTRGTLNDLWDMPRVLYCDITYLTGLLYK